MSIPLLSIVVPTKDRYNCLISLINLIDSFKSELIELVIQDNNNDNSPILSYIKDKEYIVYNHIPDQIPISLNSDKAILNSTGEYVCFIGDDDGVTNYIIDCVKWMKLNNIDVVVPSTLSYYWPSYISSSTGNISGSISFKKMDYTYKKMDIPKVLKDIMNAGFINRGNLPLVYHGIAKRSVLSAIYKHTGTFFPGQSPDIANGVALCFFAKKYYTVNCPIIITGASLSHGGGIRKLKKGYAEIEDIPFLSTNAKDEWEPRIPKIWCGPTVWCESAVKALRKTGHQELISEVNFEKLYVSMAVGNKYLIQLSKKYSSNVVIFYINFAINFFKRYLNAVIRIFMRKIKLEYPITLERIYGIDTIVDANKYIMERFPNKPF